MENLENIFVIAILITFFLFVAVSVIYVVTIVKEYNNLHREVKDSKKSTDSGDEKTVTDDQ